MAGNVTGIVAEQIADVIAGILAGVADFLAGIVAANCSGGGGCAPALIFPGDPVAHAAGLSALRRCGALPIFLPAGWLGVPNPLPPSLAEKERVAEIVADFLAVLLPVSMAGIALMAFIAGIADFLADIAGIVATGILPNPLSPSLPGKGPWGDRGNGRGGVLSCRFVAGIVAGIVAGGADAGVGGRGYPVLVKIM